MNLIPWRHKREDGNESRGLTPFEQLRGDMDTMFDQFFRGWDNNWLQPTGWSPSVDVTESDKAVTVRVEVPGIDPKDLDISISGDVLTISGEKKGHNEKNEGGVHRKESYYGSFRRSIPLPAVVNPEQVKAEQEHGVVTIEMAKTAESKARKIEVKAK